jgi:hypothetical protein
MKKIFNKYVEIMIEGVHKTFVDTSIWNDYRYLDVLDTATKTEHFTDYDALFEAVVDGKIRGAKVDYTLFGSKPYLCFTDADALTHHNVNRKNFAGVTVRVRYVEVKSYTLKALYEELPADEFLAYCADRNEKFLENLSKRG